MSTKVLMTIDWEPWFALYPYSDFWEKEPTLIDEPTDYLLDLLRRHNIKAIWYVLGWLGDRKNRWLEDIKREGHKIGDHTYYHTYNYSEEDFKKPFFRSPRFKGQKHLHSGGFFLRAMPYWWLKREVEKEGVFFIHPHDILLSHPKLPNLLHNLKRQIGLKTSRDKLERLCREVQFADPNKN